MTTALDLFFIAPGGKPSPPAFMLFARAKLIRQSVSVNICGCIEKNNPIVTYGRFSTGHGTIRKNNLLTKAQHVLL
jgi:hypothetical protein